MLEIPCLDVPERFADLPASEATLLWTIRTWVLGHIRQQDVSERIANALRDLGVERSVSYLEGFMWALSRGALRPLHILCLCRTEVSADERSMLDAFALLQQNEHGEAHTVLCTLLSDPAATVAVRSAEGVAEAFLRAGVTLPWAETDGSYRAAIPQRVLH